MVNSSNLPINILILKIHFALSGRGAKEPVGPIISPRPGPTLEIEVTAPDMAVKKSSPTKERAIATNENDMAYKNRKLMTDSGTSSGSGFPL